MSCSLLGQRLFLPDRRTCHLCRGSPISVWPRSCWKEFRSRRRRVERFLARRRPSLPGLIAVSVVALAGFVAGGVNFTVRLAHERNLARDQERQAEEARESEAEKGYFMGIALAQRELQDGRPTRAHELLEAAPARHRHWEWHYLRRLTTGGPLFHLFGHAAEIYGMALSPNGQLVATAS